MNFSYEDFDWFNAAKDCIWYPYAQMKSMSVPVKVKSANKCTIMLENGKGLLDGVSSWWSSCHGYNHPYIIEKMKKQIDIMPHIMFAGTAHKPAYELAYKLTKATKSDRVFFTDSGSTAVETSMKTAVQFWKNKGYKNRNKFVCFKNGYHGDTMGCMSLCDPDRGMHKHFNSYMPDQYYTDIPDNEDGFKLFSDFINLKKDKIAGVIIEPLVQGAGGMKFHTPETLKKIYEITKENDLLFIADEIMTGFGRTGSMFACEEASVIPDLMCVGKALTGGVMTLAAVLSKSFIFDAFLSDTLEDALMSGPTFMANPLACSAANASFDLFLKEDRMFQVKNIETQLKEELEVFKSFSRVTDVRVKGAIGVIELETNMEEIFLMREEFIKMGVWLRPFSNIIYIMPAFIITEEELTFIIKSIYKLLVKING